MDSRQREIGVGAHELKLDRLEAAASLKESLVSSRERQIRLTTACRAEVMSSPGCQVR